MMEDENRGLALAALMTLVILLAISGILVMAVWTEYVVYILGRNITYREAVIITAWVMTMCGGIAHVVAQGGRR